MITKKLELTSQQYNQLIKLVYLGYWMSNAQKDDPDPFADEIEQHIYSYASVFGYSHLIEFDTTLNKYLPATDFEEEMESSVQAYDDYVFWEELAWRMAERDFSKKFDHAHVLCMTGDEILREKNTIADRYFEEFKLNGVENLHYKP
jgi:hypothetical protein